MLSQELDVGMRQMSIRAHPQELDMRIDTAWQTLSDYHVTEIRE